MPWSYSGDPNASDKDAVRFEVQDTNPNAPLLQDAEVEFCILDESGQAAQSPRVIDGANLFSAAARCLEVLSRLFAAQADTEAGTLRVVYSRQAQGYAQRAQALRDKAAGLRGPYTGGQSIQEKEFFANNPDRVQPAFTRDQFNSPYTGGTGYLPEDYGPPVTE